MKKKITFLTPAFVCLILTSQLLFANNDQLAGVMVLPFVNQSNMQEYDWLSTNIADAIEVSMKEQFRFRSIEKITEGSLNAAGWNSQDFNRNISQPRRISNLAHSFDADIVVLGSYVYDGTKDVIVVSLYVYHESRREITHTEEFTTSITGEIFAMADRAAESTITHIRDVALEFQVADADSDDGERVELTRSRQRGTIERNIYFGLGYGKYSNEYLHLDDVSMGEYWDNLAFQIKFGLTGYYRSGIFYDFSFQYSYMEYGWIYIDGAEIYTNVDIIGLYFGLGYMCDISQLLDIEAYFAFGLINRWQLDSDEKGGDAHYEDEDIQIEAVIGLRFPFVTGFGILKSVAPYVEITSEKIVGGIELRF